MAFCNCPRMAKSQGTITEKKNTYIGLALRGLRTNPSPLFFSSPSSNRCVLFILDIDHVSCTLHRGHYTCSWVDLLYKKTQQPILPSSLSLQRTLLPPSVTSTSLCLLLLVKWAGWSATESCQTLEWSCQDILVINIRVEVLLHKRN